MHDEPYWDETAYYQFNLKQIEQDLEDPTAEIHQMCLAVVERVVQDEQLLERFQIPSEHWETIRNSWLEREPSLYSRLDLAYSGSGPAKLYENNADTPTSLYETGFWQWLWLEDKIESGQLPATADQFNSLQDQLIERFQYLNKLQPGKTLHVSCCKESVEDRGTVQYLQDCATQAGIDCKFIYIEDIGHGHGEQFTDLEDHIIEWMFKLYPWEFMFRETYGLILPQADVQFLEPPWKAILSNKELLALLWEMFPEHPNLLPSFFADDPQKSCLTHYVKKPIFAREGANVSIVKDGITVHDSGGPYGEEGFIYQAYQPLAQFGDQYTLIGSWLVNDQPAGISVREDTAPITQDLSRYLPHVII